jgi:lipopolysaccharide transport system permease protein
MAAPADHHAAAIESRTPATDASGAHAPAPEGRPTTVLRAPSVSFGTLWHAAHRLAQYRDLLHTLSVHRLRVRYKQSALGPFWAVLQPVSLMLIYTVIFSHVARVETGGIPYPLFAYSALLPWTAFATAVATATNSLVSHFNLVTKVYFPREILPLTYVIAAIVDLLTGGLVLAGLMLYFGVPITVHVLFLVPIVVVLATFALATSLVLCAIQVRYRDIGIAMPLVLQVWMFATPVVYPLSAVPPDWRTAYMLNPMVGVIDSFRRVLVEGTAPDPAPLALAALLSAVLLPAAFLYFKHVEATVADVL